MNGKQVLTQIGKVYEEATASDWRVYQDTMALVEKDYREAEETFKRAIAQAEKEWQEASAPDWEIYQDAVSQASRECK